MILDQIDITVNHFDDTVRDGYFLFDDTYVFFMDYEYTSNKDCSLDYKVYLVKTIYDDTLGYYKLTYKPKYEGSKVYGYDTMTLLESYEPVSEQCLSQKDIVITITMNKNGQANAYVIDNLHKMVDAGLLNSIKIG